MKCNHLIFTHIHHNFSHNNLIPHSIRSAILNTSFNQYTAKLVVGFKADCLTRDLGLGGMPSVGVFLRDPIPYLCEFLRKPRKTLEHGKIQSSSSSVNFRALRLWVPDASCYFYPFSFVLRCWRFLAEKNLSKNQGVICNCYLPNT